MNTADHLKAKELSKQIKSMGLKPKAIVVEKKTKTLDFLNNYTKGKKYVAKTKSRPSPFKFNYDSLSKDRKETPQLTEEQLIGLIEPLVIKYVKEPVEITPEIVKQIVQMMHDLPEVDKLEVSKGIRNAQSFIFGGTKYQTSELMHGGGGSSSSTGYQQPLTGAVDGINQTFTWTTAPSVIVVDQGRPMQKVSSDGSVNWTGTTTTVLTIAPTFDIYAVA